MSFSGHCLNFRFKCNSTSLLTSANHSHEKPRKLQPSLQKKYILTSSSCSGPFLIMIFLRVRICNGCRIRRVPRCFGSTSPYLPGPNPAPHTSLLRALSLSPADGLLTSAESRQPIARDEEKTHGIFAFTIQEKWIQKSKA